MYYLLLLVWLLCITAGLSNGVVYNNKARHQEYDYIVVGAGSAGATAANGLSADGSQTVLVLEAGGKPNPVTEIPALALKLAYYDSDLYWTGPAEKQDNACQASPQGLCSWNRAKVLGGCSTHNTMCWARGNKRDYDNWEVLGAKGWNFKQTLQAFKETENCTDPNIRQNEFHGTSGYQTVSPLPYKTKLGAAILKAGQEIGYETLDDYNGAKQQGFAYMQTSLRDGLRCSTEKAFLRPVAEKENIDILTRAYVLNVTFDHNKKVQGVWFDHENHTKFIGVKKEVLLSAGGISTPMILMLSGIGPRQHLEELKIPVVMDLPGVGQNLQDHPFFQNFNYLINDSIGIVLAGDAINYEPVAELLNGEGPLTSPASLEVVAFVSSKYINESEEWPDLMFLGSVSPLSLVLPLDTTNKSGLGLSVVLLRPKSRGFLKLRSANPYDDPIADPKYFSDRQDVLSSIEGARIVQSLMNTPTMRSLNPQPYSKVLPECKHLDTNSVDYIECGLRNYIFAGIHYSGTCKMGDPKDEDTVVDHELRVKGVKGLRVADASVMPEIISGTPNAVCIMIGHRAAGMMLSSNGK